MTPTNSERQTRRAFFFPHALDPGRKPWAPPGRVPFNVHATLVSETGVTSDDAVIFSDGYEENVVGSNQDPCFFSEPLGPIHSFCRIDKRNRDYYVREASGRHDRLLSHCVRAGDLILYGKYIPRGGHGPTTQIWVDAVLVVDDVLRWRTSRRSSREPCNDRGRCKMRRFVIAGPDRLIDGRTTMTTDIYRYNLADAEPTGLHCCTSLEDYGVILGKTQPTPSALKNLLTSFVPLSTSSTGPTTVTTDDFEADDWKNLKHLIDNFIRPIANGPKGGWIVEFPDFCTAAALCKAVVLRSGGIIAIPPIKPTGLIRRWDPAIGGIR